LRVIQPPPPQIQLRLPDFGDFAATRRGGTRTDIASPQPSLSQLDIKTSLEMHRIKNMPPGLRELYSAWLGAGRYAVITPALDVLARWLRREDPTKGLEEFQTRATAASYASPWAHVLGQGFGLLGLGGLAARGLMARGAELGARGAVEQLLAGLRAGAKPAAVGGAAGAAAGATVGAATGRDPLAEAVRFGVLGATAGLGATRERLIAAGLLGGAVGGSTAKEYGVEKGIEAGVAVFPLPVVAPERLARGVFVGLTAGRRLRSELVTEPGVATPSQQPRVELPTMQDVRMYMLLTRRSFSDVVADLARQAPPDERRGIFTNVVEMALERLRAGYDRDAVLAVLRSVRSKLDPSMRAQFDEVLRQYGLTDVKTTTPEYQLTEESATALNQFLKTRMPEYSLTDESAKLLNQFLKQRQEPQYALTDEVAQRLNLFLRRTPEYALTDEVAARLDQFLRVEPRRIQLQTLSGPSAKRIQLMMRSEPEPRSYMLLKTRSEPQTGEAVALLDQLFRQEPALVYSLALRTRPDQRHAVAPTTVQRTAQQTATTPLQTGVTTTDTPSRETTTTPPPDQPPNSPPPGTPPRTPPPGVPPYIPPWMLNLPASVVLPLLAQMGLRLPPPPNPHMPLGAYLRMLRFPALGRQREVFVLI